MLIDPKELMAHAGSEDELVAYVERLIATARLNEHIAIIERDKPDLYRTFTTPGVFLKK